MRAGWLLALLALSCAAVVLATEVDMGVDAEMEAGVDVGTEVSSEVQLPGYREQIAQQLRFFAQTTYCSVDSVTAWQCPICKQGSLVNFKLTHKFFDPNTNTFGYAGLAPAAGENIIVFSFRGATPSAGRNWITDLNAQRMPYPGLRGATVHKGFYHSYLSIARQINLAAKSLLANCQHCHVYVTGHSLGGAIATLAAADLYALTPDLTLYTFGSPRVGDLTFATYFDKIVPDTWRVVNNHDLVPHIPQRFLGFRHVSREVWYYSSQGSQFKQCNGGEDDSCSNSVNLHVDENSIRDHASYLDQPMGCRPADLSRMGLISLLETSVDIKESSRPIDKLKAQYANDDQEASSFLELEVDRPRQRGVDRRAERERIEGGVSRREKREALRAAHKQLQREKMSSKKLTQEEQLALEQAAEYDAERLRLSGGKEVFAARVLDPLSKPGLRQLENSFHKIQSNWSKLPVSWNPRIKEETAEDRWNRKYPEPK